MAIVLLAYAGSDREKVIPVSDAIEAAGHHVLAHRHDPTIGDSLITDFNAMLKQVKEADYLVLFYGLDELSPWCQRQWFSVLWRRCQTPRREGGPGTVLLPVLLQKGAAIPAILADLKYADFTTNPERAIGQLLKAIKTEDTTNG